MSTSLIGKAISSEKIEMLCVDPRSFCDDKHQQIDDDPYGGGAGLVMKAPPVIAAIRHSVSLACGRTAIIITKPSHDVFTQQSAHTFAEDYDTLVYVCGRYEGIDHRVCLRGRESFGNDRYELSIGSFVTLGGELPAMTMTEAVVRLVPGVIKEQESREKESYRPQQGGQNIEHPHYTRPQSVEGYGVPEVLLSGNHAAIDERRHSKESSTTSPL